MARRGMRLRQINWDWSRVCKRIWSTTSNESEPVMIWLKESVCIVVRPTDGTTFMVKCPSPPPVWDGVAVAALDSIPDILIQNNPFQLLSRKGNIISSGTGASFIWTASVWSYLYSWKNNFGEANAAGFGLAKSHCWHVSLHKKKKKTWIKWEILSFYYPNLKTTGEARNVNW